MLLLVLFLMATGAYAGNYSYVHLKVPRVVLPSQDKFEVECKYEGEVTLLKWYKGPNEFFRFNPTELPVFKASPLLGIGSVSMVYCGSTRCRVRLGNLTEDATGVYRCDEENEIEDPPTYATNRTHIRVYRFGTRRKPMLEGLAKEFCEGDEMVAYCLLTDQHNSVRWYINEKEQEQLRGNLTFRYKSSRLLFQGMPPTVTIQCAEVEHDKLLGSGKVTANWIDKPEKPTNSCGREIAQEQTSRANGVSSSNILMIIMYLCI